jgi:hypothetical protein
LAERAPPADLVRVDQLLTSCPDKEAVSLVTREVSRLLMSNRPDAALRVWASLQHYNFHNADFSTTARQILTKVDFSNPLDGPGFNWHINQTPGIQVRRLTQRHSVEFSFDGSEPEVSILFFQPVVLVTGTSYRIKSRVHSETNDESGFSWRLVELSAGKTPETGAGNTTSRLNDSLSWTFQAPSTPKTLVVAFTYVRPASNLRRWQDFAK